MVFHAAVYYPLHASGTPPQTTTGRGLKKYKKKRESQFQRIDLTYLLRQVKSKRVSGGGGSTTAQRWRQLGGGAAAVAASAAVAAARQCNVGGSLAAAAASAAVAAARSVAAVHSVMAAAHSMVAVHPDSGNAVAAAQMLRQWRQRDSKNVSGSLAAARRRRQRQRRWRCTARRRQRGGSRLEAAADLPAPSVNAPTHALSNATNAPTYASLSLVKDGGTTAPTASSLLAATAVPVAMSTAVADAPPLPTTPPTATPTASFVKLKLIFSNLCCPGINSILQHTLKITKLNMCCS